MRSLVLRALQAEQEETIECISDAVSGAAQLRGDGNAHASACERDLLLHVLSDVKALVLRLRLLHARTVNSFTGTSRMTRISEGLSLVIRRKEGDASKRRQFMCVCVCVGRDASWDDVCPKASVRL